MPDQAQAAVIAHRQGQGPLVVLGAPGTGKTSTLVEAVAARVERDGVPADGVLVLAPTRQAAASLRERLSARLASTVREPLARSPHSYAFGLLRRVRVLAGDAPPRLLSGPEQDRVLAELLAGHAAGEGRVPTWPASIDPEVLALRGLRDELRDLLMRAVERGLDPAELADLGRSAGRPDWVAAADVLEEYLDVTALATPGGYDPAAIVDAAAALLADDAQLLAAERQRLALVAVDDAQELGAASAQLLDLLAGGGRDLVLAGDPDAATQTFRGALPRLLAGAAHRYPGADGAAAATVVLPTVWRHGPRLRAVAHRVADRIGSAGAVAHRLAAAAPGGPDGQVAVHLLTSPAQEGAFVAQELRRQHLLGGVPWSRMAVVLRSTRGTQGLRRALAAGGVPVTVPAMELPVRDEPGVRPLRLALGCVLQPDSLTAEVAVELLTGPVGGSDPVALRRLRRALRAEEVAGGGNRPSHELLVEALGAPIRLASLDVRVAAPASRVAAVLAAGRAAAAEPGAAAEQVLWAIWQATRLAEPWRRAALAGGQAAGRADRDLDAVVALFEAAARFTDRLPRAGAGQFLGYLEGQELPADTLAGRAPDGEAVSLLSVHGAAGREWDVVAVPGVQQGSWPDLRLRGSLLGAQHLADLLDGRAAGPGVGGAGQRRQVLDDELRLFHVAVSRARRQLLVTAVSSADDIPSPLLDLVEGGATDTEDREPSAVPRALTLPALVAELRAAVVDQGSAAARRATAAMQLARLVAAGVPGAGPEDWYGLAEPSGRAPLRAPGEPVRVSPSRVESYERCALRWLLEHCGGTDGGSSAQLTGTLIHEIAQLAPAGDAAALRALLDERWDGLQLGTGWLARRERRRAEAMLDRLAGYLAGQDRELLAVERPVEVRVGRAEVHGTVDRLERDRDGRLVVVDLKTGTRPRQADLPRNPQLGVYQLAVQEGGFDDVAPGAREPGGALLVQLKTGKGAGVQRQPALAEDDDPAWARRLVQQVADGMAGEHFAASTNPMCRTCPVRRSCPAHPEGRQVTP